MALLIDSDELWINCKKATPIFGMPILVWCPDRPTYPARAVWAESFNEIGVPGEDFTHWVYISAPNRRKD